MKKKSPNRPRLGTAVICFLGVCSVIVGIPGCARQRHQMTIQAECPAVIHAHEATGGALALTANERPAVRAAVEEGVIAALPVSSEKYGTPCHHAGEIARRRRQF